MAPPPSPEDIARWDRWFACEMTNRAWDIAEKTARTASEHEEMLHAAHAGALHWSRIGTDLHKARAEMLLAHVHALAGNGAIAMPYARRGHEYITTHESPDWEIAFAHAILANAARAAGDPSLYATEYALAKTCGEAIGDTEDKEIFERTFRLLPAPQGV
jgi:hypothetical protein